MPTYQALPRFLRDHRALTDDERRQFRKALESFVRGLEEGAGRFDRRLRVHRIDSTGDVWSLSWGEGGRATFQYGRSIRAGEPHIIWRRVGGHAIYRAP